MGRPKKIFKPGGSRGSGGPGRAEDRAVDAPRADVLFVARQRLVQCPVAGRASRGANMMNGSRTSGGWRLAVCAAAAILAACAKNASTPAESGAAASAQVGANGEKYPAPRWPSYFK